MAGLESDGLLRLSALNEGRFGFEETAYLLLLGHLPNQEELDSFTKQLSYYRIIKWKTEVDAIESFTSSADSVPVFH